MSTREELIEFMLHRCENYAATAAIKVIDLGAIDELYIYLLLTIHYHFLKFKSRW